MSDERGGVPSSSGVDALLLCPAKWRMEKNCGVQTADSAIANRGTAIHLAIESGDIANLNYEDGLEARKLATREQASVDQWLADIGESFIEETRREERFWLASKDGNGRLFSGKPDVVHRAGGNLCVVDYKTGFTEYDPAETNIQLACNAMLAAKHFGATNVRVVLLQARFATSEADYDEDALSRMEHRVRGLIQRIAENDGEPIAGEKQCRYCKAFGVCPAVRDFTLDAMSSRTLAVVPSGTELRAFAVIEKLIAERRRLARLALSQGVEIVGWTLGNGRRTVKVTDPSEAFARVSPVIQPETFATACDVSLPKVAELYAKATGLGKGKARENLERLWDGIISETVSEGSLKQVKEVNNGVS
jgi:hypothetical protein